MGNTSQASAEAALNELSRRRIFSEEDIQHIANATVRIGMPEEAGLCAWGYYWYDLNTTTTAAGTTKQYVIGDGSYNPRKYLYVENGVVVGTQQ